MRNRNKLYTGVAAPANIIGSILTMMAGWVDSVGVCVFLNENSSFLTGRVARLGKYILNKNINNAKDILLIIISFIIGAFVSTLITRRLGLTGGLIFTGIFIILTSFINPEKGAKLAFITMPMCMGSQNAATSLTPISRTTHLTGPATDIGINMAKGNWDLVMFWVLRWISFFVGVASAYKLISVFKARAMNLPHILLVPGIVILLTGIIQRMIFNIPLSEG